MGKGKDKNRRESFTLKNRFRYWFDNRMAKGAFGLIRVLIAVSILLAVIIAAMIIILSFAEEGEEASTFWDSIATVINAEVPYFADGSLGYVLLMALVAIVGVLFTSVLIGIITSGIEGKIETLKKGNSLVLEKGHVVVLGFYPGEYTLLNQLILAAEGKPDCVIIADNVDREEMEQGIEENLDVPENFRFVCRTADITDPASLEKCSLETCRTIIVSPTEDMRTIKAVLAVSTLLEGKGVHGIGVNAIISRNEYRFPTYLAEANNICTLQTNDILARMIAHSCTQTGLSESFREVFNFEGSEFYLANLPGIEGMTFGDIMLRISHSVPIGVYRNGKVNMNPPAKYVLHEDDRILVFSEESSTVQLIDLPAEEPEKFEIVMNGKEDTAEVLFIGHNESLLTILRELPENVTRVFLGKWGLPEENQSEFELVAKERGFELEYYSGNPHTERVLFDLAHKAEHIVVLSDHNRDPEAADMDGIFLLLNLRDVRTRYKLNFNITVELQKEHNQKLVGHGDHTDFLVASSMSSLILAQLAECPELLGVFNELLTNEGNELYLKRVDLWGLTGKHKVRDLRRVLLNQGCILLGYLDSNKVSRFNLPLDEELMLFEEDNLIVIAEN